MKKDEIKTCITLPRDLKRDIEDESERNGVSLSAFWITAAHMQLNRMSEEQPVPELRKVEKHVQSFKENDRRLFISIVQMLVNLFRRL